ncbi:MAG: membrane protein insertase YidC [Tyzzerella sp.]|nr:membrane protein insertase YidC [Tyzzerella sp.]
MGILLTQRGGLIGPIAKLFGFIMNAIFEALSSMGIENIGLCIILFTIIIYMLMLPLQIKQQKFSRISSVMNPEIQAIQKKYANKKDQTSMYKMQEETKLIYEKYGTSPTGGCLGSLIQLPFLFALWPVVQNIPAYVNGLKEAYNKFHLIDQIKATEGYQKILESFISDNKIMITADKIKGTNSIVDILYKLQDNTWDALVEVFPKLSDSIEQTQEYIRGYNYFPISTFGINIGETPSSMFSEAIANGFSFATIGMIIVAVLIPILAGLTQWLSVKISQNMMNPQNGKKQEENQMAQQMNMMMKIMPLMSVFFCFTMPSGLGLYWITSAVVRTIQQVFINKNLKKKSIDQIVKENSEKAAKKYNKSNTADGKNINNMATKYTRRIEEMKNETIAEAEKKQTSGAKPGSLTAKANMVSDYNNRKNK